MKFFLNNIFFVVHNWLEITFCKKYFQHIHIIIFLLFFDSFENKSCKKKLLHNRESLVFFVKKTKNEYFFVTEIINNQYICNLKKESEMIL